MNLSRFKNMCIFRLFIVMSLLGCQHKAQQNHQTPSSGPQDPKGSPGDLELTKLQVSLKLEEYQKGNISGVLFKPTLDPKARYLSYRICSVEKSNLCVDGKLDGLLPDLVYDVPNGKVNVQYSACVFPEEAKSASFCGPNKVLVFDHQGENSPPLQLALVASQELTRNIRNYALETRAVFHQYKATEQLDQKGLNLNYFDTLVFNQIEMNSFLLGRVYDSQLMSSYTAKVAKLLNERAKYLNPLSNGIALFLIGSNKVYKAMLEQLKNDYNSSEISQDIDAAVTNSVEVFLSHFDNQVAKQSLLERLGLIMQSLQQSKSDKETYNAKSSRAG